MNLLYLDATAGISGDMTVAALLDLGLPLDHLQEQLATLALPPDSFTLVAQRVERRGMAGLHLDVRLPGDDHHHHGAHGHHHHRSYADIRAMIAASGLNERVKATAQRIFLRLAEAEALVHDTTVDAVTFHEVGAVDSIVDIVATAIGLDYLQVGRLHVSAVPLGGGFVETAHGRLPVPAPATAKLLTGCAVHARCGDGERVTPTGAAILAALAERADTMPEMTITRIGHGAGTKDFADCPNLLRAFLGTTPQSSEQDMVREAVCNLDDVTPEQLGYTLERLLEAGALDVWHTAIQMKKNRPAVQLSFLCTAAHLDALIGLVMAETGSLGVRVYEVTRRIAPRTVEERLTPWGTVHFKRSPAGIKPEYEDCRRIAREQGLPLREVQQRLLREERNDRR
ncbi:nickel pincer cofactor biosynthesis protein LarC [Trichlorobacter ammonificans]|uniref:Putative nickel insertion protein n=1 Tax=Trichlorobacter ammonificans TaxID=2916410 RepID=A0ABM9DAY9_9BACT|nr:nickel pincer cofactor biosynthesis protein LarC [Trichlorobacter ammonificans]CAH2032415.1 Putative nickel insertion protein [Trichlorobacter ammonificans]